ncbi:MAG TPA: ATP-binding cassette domain-containing protein [Thermomicrobiales bacterium]|nr:ATP-binding cassette domain-containing protein [Thermomicrobiales bacterium]
MAAISSAGIRPVRAGARVPDSRHAIVAEGLRKEFPGGVVAVAGVDLDVRAGETFGFLGPNGAGKTTTVRMLTTLMRPTAGRATVAGFDLYRQAHDIRRSIGVALQEAGLDAMATGRELLTLQGRLFGISPPRAERRATELLELLGLVEAANRRIGTYSGGMKRRLDLASALVHGPRLLFLDEPTEGLDPASRQAVWREIGRLNRELGLTVFLTTHYLEEADSLADRLAIIDRGRIVADGTPGSLKATIGGSVVTVGVRRERLEDAATAVGRLANLRELRLGDEELTLFVKDGNGVVADVVRLLDAAGIVVGSVAIAEPTLDEVFLRATGSRLEGAAQNGGSST